MEKLFKKVGKKYVECGYDVKHQMSDGIWMVQNKPSSHSQTSLVWRVGDLKRPVDVVTVAALESFNGELANYLTRLTEESSDELKEAREILGGYLKGPVSYLNISASDLCSLFLRRIAMECEETAVPKGFNEVFYKFRKEKNLKSEEIQLLYQLEEWLKLNNIKLKM